MKFACITRRLSHFLLPFLAVDKPPTMVATGSEGCSYPEVQCCANMAPRAGRGFSRTTSINFGLTWVWCLVLMAVFNTGICIMSQDSAKMTTIKGPACVDHILRCGQAILHCIFGHCDSHCKIRMLYRGLA